MRAARALVAGDPLQFGRAIPVVEERRWSVTDDLQLFATTFAAGFLFVSILIG